MIRLTLTAEVQNFTMVVKNLSSAGKHTTLTLKDKPVTNEKNTKMPTPREKTRGEESGTASAQSIVESAAPQRPHRNTKDSLCVKCSNLVRAKENGLQCEICSHREHLECSSVGVRLYGHLQADQSRQLLYICSKCTDLRKKGQPLILPGYNVNNPLTKPIDIDGRFDF